MNAITRDEVHEKLRETLVAADLKVENAVLKLRLWIISSILANVVALAAVSIPSVLYLGQVKTQAQTAIGTVTRNDARLNERAEWMKKRMLWESSAQQFMISIGWAPPQYLLDNPHDMPED